MSVQYKKEGQPHEIGDDYIIDPFDRHWNRNRNTNPPAKPFVGQLVRKTATQGIISENGGDRKITIRLDSLYGDSCRVVRKQGFVDGTVWRYSDEVWKAQMAAHKELADMAAANKAKADDKQAKIDWAAGIKEGYPESAVKILRELAKIIEASGRDLQHIIRNLQDNELRYTTQFGPELYVHTLQKARAVQVQIIEFLDDPSQDAAASDHEDWEALRQKLANEMAKHLIADAGRERNYIENHARKIVLEAVAKYGEVTCPVW